MVVVALDAEVLGTMRQMHTRPITALHYYTTTRVLVSGANDGSLKVWDQLWQLKHAFVGHTKAITAIAPHPYVCHGSMCVCVCV